jgi:hypothetical protein
VRAGSILLAFAWSSLMPVVSAAQGHPTPPAEVVRKLSRHHHHHDWWRITTDAARFEVRVDRIDAEGLAGVIAAPKSPPAPERIAWGSIPRIDLKKTHETRGKITGTLLGMCAGFIPLANGNANSSQPRNYMLVGAAAGYWLGGKVGAGNVHERPLYVAPTPPLAPAVAPRATAVLDSASAGVAAGPATALTPDSSVTDTAAPVPSAAARPVAPATTVATATAIASTAAATPAIASACRRITPESLLRIDGEFGRFCGYASTVGPEGLGGLRVETTQHSIQSPGSLAWDRIERIELHGSNAGSGALRGGMMLGVFTGLLGFPLAAVIESSGGSGDPQTPAIVLGCAAVGAAVGALIGAAVGASVTSWHRVYQRP